MPDTEKNTYPAENNSDMIPTNSMVARGPIPHRVQLNTIVPPRRSLLPRRDHTSLHTVGDAASATATGDTDNNNRRQRDDRWIAYTFFQFPSLDSPNTVDVNDADDRDDDDDDDDGQSQIGGTHGSNPSRTRAFSLSVQY